MSKQERDLEKIEGLCRYSIDCHVDDRGSLFTSNPILGQTREFCTDKFSISKKGVLRGLHGDYDTAKLIFCAWGKIQLAVVDARPMSPTFGKSQDFILETFENSKSIEAVLVPEGCLNGHLVLSETAVFYYQWTQPYNLGKQMSVRYDDPDLGISWVENPTCLSERDRNSKTLKEVLRGSD
jgi:dTDP-4-dehydrorhamnose 3,5-epimerase